MERLDLPEGGAKEDGKEDGGEDAMKDGKEDGGDAKEDAEQIGGVENAEKQEEALEEKGDLSADSSASELGEVHFPKEDVPSESMYRNTLIKIKDAEVHKMEENLKLRSNQLYNVGGASIAHSKVFADEVKDSGKFREEYSVEPYMLDQRVVRDQSTRLKDERTAFLVEEAEKDGGMQGNGGSDGPPTQDGDGKASKRDSKELVATHNSDEGATNIVSLIERSSGRRSDQVTVLNNTVERIKRILGAQEVKLLENKFSFRYVCFKCDSSEEVQPMWLQWESINVPWSDAGRLISTQWDLIYSGFMIKEQGPKPWFSSGCEPGYHFLVAKYLPLCPNKRARDRDGAAASGDASGGLETQSVKAGMWEHETHGITGMWKSIHRMVVCKVFREYLDENLLGNDDANGPLCDSLIDEYIELNKLISE